MATAVVGATVQASSSSRAAQLAEVRRTFCELDRRRAGGFTYSELGRMLSRCVPIGDRGFSEAELEILFRAADPVGRGRLSAEQFVDSLTASQSPEVFATVQQLRRRMGAGPGRPVVCVLGSATFQGQDTEELVRRAAQELSAALPSPTILLTGGLPGVQQTFASHCVNPSRLWNLTLHGAPSGYGIGTDLACAPDNAIKQEVTAHLADVYITFEGGAGVAREARLAFARGATVIPVSRTGGASSGMFDFPAASLRAPDAVKAAGLESQWARLGDKEASLAECAVALARVVAAMLPA